MTAKPKKHPAMDAWVSERAVVNEAGCWVWQRGIAPNGYGKASDRCAHRVVYERLVGTIPVGLDLDHTCHDPSECVGGVSCPHRRCVNPAHLEPTTRRTNLLRGNTSPARLAARTHCDNGHPLSGENLFVERSGSRRCRICKRRREAAGRRRRKAVKK